MVTIFELSFINFINTNRKRFLFYKSIHDYFIETKESQIERERLVNFGNDSGMSYRATLDEIIGCLYAPFLMQKNHDSGIYEITYNGKRRFREFFCENNNVEAEFAFTLRFSNKIIFKKSILDTMSEEKINYLIQNKWTRNKSLMRLMRKVGSYEDYLITVSDILHVLDYAERKTGNYIDLIDLYGRQYKKSNNIGCNLHSRFYAKSNLIKKYTCFFKKVLDYCQKPIDWGGKSINFMQLNNFLICSGIIESIDDFLLECIHDGLFRYIDDQNITLTSTGYTVLTTFFNKYDIIQLIVRKTTSERYMLSVGLNNEFLDDVMQILANKSFTLHDKWYESELDKTELIDLFKEFYINKSVEFHR